MSKPEIPAIEEIKLSTLVRDIALSGRSEKEIAANAKELAPMMADGWSPSQPGEYFERGGKKHLVAGFTRTEAALSIGQKIGYFVAVPDNATELRLACIRTNAGKPISPFEQGRIFSAMEKGTDAETAKAGEEILAPMKHADIAKAAGKTPQWISRCIAIFQNPPAIAELIASGKVSANVADKANQLQKDEGKRLSWLKKAIKSAESEGKESASMKHLDAHRADFAPLKAKPAAPPPEPKEKEDDEPGKEDKKEKNSDENTTPPPPPPKGQPQGEMDLGTSKPSEKPKPSAKKLRAAIEEIVGDWSDGLTKAPSSGDCERLVDALVKISLPF